MDWINEPRPIADARGICVIRICFDKDFCDGYLCPALYCTSNG